jgi:hypothetical protein
MPILTGFTDLQLTPFTYFKTTYKTQSPGQDFTSDSVRFGNQVFPIYKTSGATRFTQFSAPFTSNNTITGDKPMSLLRLANTSSANTSGIGSNLLRPCAFRPNHIVDGVNIDIDFMGFDLINIATPLYFKIGQFQPANNSSEFGTLPQVLPNGFLGNDNYTPLGPTWGLSDNVPLILRWTTTAFITGDANLIRPILTDATTYAMFDNNAWRCQTCPNGFIFSATADTYTTQKFTYIFMSRDGTRYWMLKFIPQSAAANAAILFNDFALKRIYIDAFGVTYFKQSNAQNTIFNSQGFGFPFLFNTTRLPYVDLPCWPPCYGVPLMKSNVL